MARPKVLRLDLTAKGEYRLTYDRRVQLKHRDLSAVRAFVQGWNESAGIPGTYVWKSLRASSLRGARGYTEL